MPPGAVNRRPSNCSCAEWRHQRDAFVEPAAPHSSNRAAGPCHLVTLNDALQKSLRRQQAAPGRLGRGSTALLAAGDRGADQSQANERQRTRFRHVGGGQFKIVGGCRAVQADSDVVGEAAVAGASRTAHTDTEAGDVGIVAVVRACFPAGERQVDLAAIIESDTAAGAGAGDVTVKQIVDPGPVPGGTIGVAVSAVVGPFPGSSHFQSGSGTKQCLCRICKMYKNPPLINGDDIDTMEV